MIGEAVGSTIGAETPCRSTQNTMMQRDFIVCIETLLTHPSHQRQFDASQWLHTMNISILFRLFAEAAMETKTDWKAAIHHAKLQQVASSVAPSGGYDPAHIGQIAALGYKFVQPIYGYELASEINPHAGE